MLICSLFSVMYWCSESSSELALVNASDSDFPETKMLVSSANSTNSPSLEQFIMSLIYIRNRSGPSTDPCGTPNSTSRWFDFSSRHSTYCFRLSR